MTTKNTAGKAAGQAAALPVADALSLRGTVTDLNALSQEGFSRIESLARVALMAMETPDAHRFPELIAKVLETVAVIAQTSADAAESSAEDAGCGGGIGLRNEQRRMDARRAAREYEDQFARGHA
jgi:hypothetical protein